MILKGDLRCARFHGWAWRVQVSRALAAAETLAKEGISAEVVDPRSLEPLDKATLIASAKKTGRLVITDESHDNCGIASGLAAIMVDEAFDCLRASIKRVTIPHVPVPFSVPLLCHTHGRAYRRGGAIIVAIMVEGSIRDPVLDPRRFNGAKISSSMILASRWFTAERELGEKDKKKRLRAKA
jgi:hypothetical protein